MNKICIFFALFISSLTAYSQTPVVDYKGKAFFELRGLNANFGGWSGSYAPSDSTLNGFNFSVEKAKRGVMPFWAVAYEFAFWDKLVVRAGGAFKFNRDKNFCLDVGIGYQQRFIPNRRFPVIVQALAVYEYWNYGVRVERIEQGDDKVTIGKTEFKAKNIDVFLGNRRSTIRPQLGVVLELSPMLQIAVEGYYGFAVADRPRMMVRGAKVMFPRHAGLWSDDSQIDIRDEQGYKMTNWNVMDTWGVRVGVFFKPLPRKDATPR